MLSPKMLKLLNAQINLEFFSSNVYLQMSAWAENEGLTGCAAFLSKHAGEEMGHMRRIWTYVLESGSMPVLGSLKEPPSKIKDVNELFEDVYKHEQHVTAKINELAQAAFEEKDMFTFNFLQWFIAEQHEEEALARTILDRIKVIGLDGKGLYFIDQEAAKLAGADAAEGAAASAS
ncbi:MAG: non-heme ferritin [Rhodospirillales bacterium]|jgi:ferritin|nr:non-heme ferritin [Rhodospirillales bacterium]